jgi:hypothetical protein
MYKLKSIYFFTYRLYGNKINAQYCITDTYYFIKLLQPIQLLFQ